MIFLAFTILVCSILYGLLLGRLVRFLHFDHRTENELRTALLDASGLDQERAHQAALLAAAILTPMFFVGHFFVNPQTAHLMRIATAIGVFVPSMISDWLLREINLFLATLGIVGGIAMGFLVLGDGVGALLGSAGAAGFFFLIFLMGKLLSFLLIGRADDRDGDQADGAEVFGEGDVWLAAAMGAFIGWSELLLLVIFCTFLLASIVHGLMYLLMPKRRKMLKHVPLGIYMGLMTMLFIGLSF